MAVAVQLLTNRIAEPIFNSTGSCSALVSITISNDGDRNFLKWQSQKARFNHRSFRQLVLYQFEMRKVRTSEVDNVMMMLGAICGSAISMDLAAQSMDPYSAQKSMDCADICGSCRVRPTDLPVLYPDLTLISLL